MTPDDDAVFDMNDCPFHRKIVLHHNVMVWWLEFTPTQAKHTSDAVKITDHHLDGLDWERAAIDLNEANS
jgi:hypothetical protein